MPTRDGNKCNSLGIVSHFFDVTLNFFLDFIESLLTETMINGYSNLIHTRL